MSNYRNKKIVREKFCSCHAKHEKIGDFDDLNAFHTLLDCYQTNGIKISLSAGILKLC